MKYPLRIFTIAIFVILYVSGTSFAQDAAVVDSTHYKVEFENDKVRVLRVTYAPGERSVMHEHPNLVGVMLTDSHGKMTFPDGKSRESKSKAGDVFWDPATKHLPENIGSEPEEVILIEIKE